MRMEEQPQGRKSKNSAQSPLGDTVEQIRLNLEVLGELGDIGASRLPEGLFTIHTRLKNVPFMLDPNIPDRIAQWPDRCGDVLVAAEGGVRCLTFAGGIEAGCIF